MTNDHDPHRAQEGHHIRGTGTGYSWGRFIELVLPVVLAAGFTGATTVAVLGERIAICQEQIHGLQGDMRELRRDLYAPRGMGPHTLRIPLFRQADLHPAPEPAQQL